MIAMAFPCMSDKGLGHSRHSRASSDEVICTLSQKSLRSNWHLPRRCAPAAVWLVLIATAKPWPSSRAEVDLTRDFTSYLAVHSSNDTAFEYHTVAVQYIKQPKNAAIDGYLQAKSCLRGPGAT